MRVHGDKRSMRSILMGIAFAATLAAGVLLGSLYDPNNAEAQPSVSFDGNGALMFHFVKPGSTADYEGIMQKLNDALEASDGRAEQARGWKVFRASADFTGQNSVPYVWVVDPVVAGANYAASAILNEVFASDIENLFNTYNGSFTDGQTKQLQVNMQLVADF